MVLALVQHADDDTLHSLPPVKSMRSELGDFKDLWAVFQLFSQAVAGP